MIKALLKKVQSVRQFLSSWREVQLWFLRFLGSRFGRLSLVLILIMTVLIIITSRYHDSSPVINYNYRRIYLSKPIMTPDFANFTKAVIEEHKSLFFHQKNKKPLLLLFTTWHSSATKWFVHHNTVRTWAMLRPLLQPVVYVEKKIDVEMEALMKRCGWKILPVPKLNAHLPIIRHMFIHATQTFNAQYYGYANSDILFDETLLLTLINIHKNKTFNDVFLIGRRINYPMGISDVMGSLDDVRKIASSDKAYIFMPQALDYFIVTRQGYPWASIPDLVVGRRGYDNLLVIHALKEFPSHVIDTSNSVLALHQSDSRGDFEGLNSINKDINMDLINASMPQYLPMVVGHTDCAPWDARLDTTTHSVLLHAREARVCQNEYHHSNIENIKPVSVV